MLESLTHSKTGTVVRAALLALSCLLCQGPAEAQKDESRDDETVGRWCRCLEDNPEALPALVRIASGCEMDSEEAARILRGVRSAHPQGIRDTIVLLSGPTATYAASAIRSLGEASVPYLCEALKGPQRLAVVVILGDLGPAAKPAAPTLVALLCAETAERPAIVDALGRIGAEEAVDTLSVIAQGKDVNLKVRAILALGQLGEKATKAIPVLLTCLKYGDPTVTDRAVWALSQMGDAAVSTAAALLDDSELQLSACIILGKLGERAGDRGRELLKLLSCENQEVRAAAVWAIGQIGCSSEEAILALVHALKDEDRYVKDNAIWALARMANCDTAVFAVSEILTAPDPDRRAAAAWILGEMRAQQNSVAEKMLLLLKDPYPQVRISAVRSLRRLPATDKSGAALLPLLLDPVREVRDETVWTLAALGDAALPHLVTALASDHEELRYGASCALYEMGTLAYEAMPHLICALSDPDVRVRTNAAGSLGRLGVLAQPAVSGLIQALKDPKPEVRLCAAWALGQVCVFAPEAALTALSESRTTEVNPQVRRMIEQVLGQLTK